MGREDVLAQIGEFQREIRERRRGPGPPPAPRMFVRPRTLEELVEQLDAEAKAIEDQLAFDLQELRRLNVFTRALEGACDLARQLRTYLFLEGRFFSERLPPEELVDIAEDVLRGFGGVRTLCRRSDEVGKVRRDIAEGVRRTRSTIRELRDRVRRLRSGEERFAAADRPTAGLLVEKVPRETGPFFGLVLQQFDRQGRILRPPPPGPTARRVRPTRAGVDLDNVTKTRDANVRLEEGEIAVDVFDSRVQDAARAHIESEAFPTDEAGAAAATEFLRSFAFDVRVLA